MNFVDAAIVGIEGAATAGLRPEHITLASSGGRLGGEISHIEHLGGETNIYVNCGAAGLVGVRMFGEHAFEIGSRHELLIDDARIYRFDEAGQRIR